MDAILAGGILPFMFSRLIADGVRNLYRLFGGFAFCLDAKFPACSRE
jgi:hypothetical protein